MPGTPGGAPLIPWIVDHAVSVRSVDAEDVDFSDLAPLVATLSGARVVMLGEPLHLEGTTFKAKVRLIKFLHQMMGFDVVVFEAGMYDSREAWKKIVAGEPPVASARQSIFALWSYSQEVQPLFEYIAAEARGPKPLELAGIDPQFTGPVGGGSGASFAADLESYLRSHGSALPDAAEWAAFRAVVDRIARQYYRDVVSTAEERDAFAWGSALLQTETARIRDSIRSFETAYWAQLADALDAHGRASWAYPAGMGRTEEALAAAMRYMMIRDSSMGRNLIWLAREGYPGRKIVVWAANQHIAKTVASVRVPNSRVAPFPPGYAPMGQLVRNALEREVYSIAFIAGSGRIGAAGVQSGEIPPPHDMPTPPPGSWESLFAQTKLPYLFLDLRNRQDQGAWMESERVALPLSYMYGSSSWPSVFDGFFFSAEMAPATRAP
jgi:erythromycin esterase